uniref:Uncharacterized protein n=1 Tax=Brassica oleracea var. oleracea TaxID=109376 RepID=A0A0D3C9W0_BRAOL
MSSSSSDEVEERLEEIMEEYTEDIFNEIVEDQTIPQRRRTYRERHREGGHARLWNDYFSEAATFSNEEMQPEGSVFLHFKNARQQFVCLLMVLRLTLLTNISDLVRPPHFHVYIISPTE